MAQNRRSILTAFAALIDAISQVTTVVRSYRPVDITQYTQAELPLINIIEPAEEPEEHLTSMKEMAWLNLNMRLYFLNWGETPDATYGGLVKAIRDKIGNNFKVSNTATSALIDSISAIGEGSEMPLYWMDFEVAIKYYLDEKIT